MSKTREDYGSGVTRPTINQDTPFELNRKFLKEFRDNTFSGSEHKDANEHIEKVLEIFDLFHILKVTQDQIMLRAFPVSLTEATSRWLRNQPSGSITTWEVLKTKFLNKYYPAAHTAKKMEEINNFRQEYDESFFRAWERFKELLMKLKVAIPSKTGADDKIAIQEMAEYSQKWHNGTSSRTKITKTSDGLAAIQAQINNLGQEIKKVNEKVYAAQVGCELCKGPHYTKDCPQKEEGKNLEEAYYTHFGAPYQPGGQCPTRKDIMEESLSKFMAESAKRHKEKSNVIKEIRASTNAAIRNQGASIKSLEPQIEQMSKLLQEKGFGSLPSSTETNPRDQVKSISTAAADLSKILSIEHNPYVVSGPQHRFIFPEIVPFLRQLHHYCCDNLKEARGVTLVDLRASVSVMPFSTYTKLSIEDLSHTRMTIELADRTIKQPKGIATNVLVRIGKFVFPIDFIILDIPEDDDVPLILGRPFLSTAHVKTYIRRIETLGIRRLHTVYPRVRDAAYRNLHNCVFNCLLVL
nr:hypothetical protein [Tanacetum cinerariifolium]